MSLRFGKLLSVFIILASIALVIAGTIEFPHLPFRHHPLFPLIVILFVIADFLLIVGAVICLAIISLTKQGRRLGSTAFLTQTIATHSTSTNSEAFRKRANFYNIKKELQKIEKEQEEIISDKEEIVNTLTEFKKMLMH